jgi:hypothetical protein
LLAPSGVQGMCWGSFVRRFASVTEGGTNFHFLLR